MISIMITITTATLSLGMPPILLNVNAAAADDDDGVELDNCKMINKQHIQARGEGHRGLESMPRRRRGDKIDERAREETLIPGMEIISAASGWLQVEASPGQLCKPQRKVPPEAPPRVFDWETIIVGGGAGTGSRS